MYYFEIVDNVPACYSRSLMRDERSTCNNTYYYLFHRLSQSACPMYIHQCRPFNKLSLHLRCVNLPSPSSPIVDSQLYLSSCTLLRTFNPAAPPRPPALYPSISFKMILIGAYCILSKSRGCWQQLYFIGSVAETPVEFNFLRARKVYTL